MNNIKNFICNIPLYIGLAIRALADMFFTFSFRLHITLNTDAGKQLKEIDAAVQKVKEHIKKAAETQQTGQVAVVKKAASDQRYSKLANIIKGTGNDSNGNG